MRFELASRPKQYAACHKLLKEMGQKNERFGWPTILAYDEHGALQGFMSTIKRKDLLEAGPLCVRTKSLKTVVRLINAYENWLLHCGMKFYWFHVQPRNAEWKKTVEKCAERYGNIRKFQDDENGAWYQRDLYDQI